MEGLLWVGGERGPGNTGVGGAASEATSKERKCGK